MLRQCAATVLVVEYGDFDNTWSVALSENANLINAPDLFNITGLPVVGLGNRSFPVLVGAVVG